MTKNKSTSRKTNKTVRMPATKFPHLQKQLKKGPAATTLRNKKGKGA